MEVKTIVEKDEKYVQVPLDQINTAEQVLQVFQKHWDKKEKVKAEALP